MPALDRSDLKLLTGVSTGVPVADMTWGESWTDDLIWTNDTNRVVSGVVSSITDPVALTVNTTIPFSGGTSAIFYVGAFVNFIPVNSTTTVFRVNYIITAVDSTNNTITVLGSPTPSIGDGINQSYAFPTGTSLQLRVREYVSSVGVTEDFKNRVLKLGQPVAKPNSTQLNLDQYIFIVDAARSWARIALPPTVFTDIPVGADAPIGNTPVIYAGSVSLIKPADAAQPLINPSTTDKLKYVWLIWSDEANIPGQ